MNKIDLNSFKKHSLTYLIGEFFNKGILLISIPIFTYLLSPLEYGQLSVFISTTSILTVLMGLNFYTALARRYHEDIEDFFSYFRTTFIFLSIVILIILNISLFFYDNLSYLVSRHTNILLYALIVSCCMVFFNFYMAYLQTSHDSKKYVTTAFFKNFFSLLLGIVIIISLDKHKYLGKIYADIVIIILISFYIIYKIFRITTGKIQLSHLLYTLKISLPMFPITIEGIILLQSDIIILNNYVDKSYVGVYSLAFNISMLIVILFTAFNNAWIPIFYRLYREKKIDEINRRIANYVSIICFASLSLILFNKYIFIILDKDYTDATQVISVMAFGFIFAYLAALFLSYGLYKKKLIAFSLVSITCAIMNIVLNIVFIPKYGILAAAYIKLLSYLILGSLYLLIVRFYLKELTFFSKKIIYLLLFSSITFIFYELFIKKQDELLYLTIALVILTLFSLFFLRNNVKTIFNIYKNYVQK